LIREHGNLEGVVEHLQQGKNPPPDDWAYDEARKLFAQPDVIKADQVDLQWTEPDVEGLVDFLVREKGFKCVFSYNGWWLSQYAKTAWTSF
jgi:flap endonuclease-1